MSYILVKEQAHPKESEITNHKPVTDNFAIIIAIDMLWTSYWFKIDKLNITKIDQYKIYIYILINNKFLDNCTN